MAPEPTQAQLAKLWPMPGLPLSGDSPARWPGHTHETTATARKYLQQDFERHHGYFNYHGAHNHTPFHILVQWSLGGTSDQMDAIWEQHIQQERYAYESPEPITERNFADHLGDEEYYQGYLFFFCDLLLKRSIDSVVQEWIFSPKANFDLYHGKPPMMLNRLIGGILHPLIYLGYGMEFRLPGLVAEGLAQAATHPATSSVLLPKAVFESPTGGRSGVHAFTVAARILHDSRFAKQKGSFDNVQKNFGADIQRYASEWSVDGSNPAEVASKVRELTFLNVMIYAVGGWRDGEGFHNAEFTLMHLLTSSMTLVSYMATLTSPTSKSLLLRAYLTRSLAYYISRGRPPLPVRSFFAAPIETEFPDPEVYASESAYPTSSTPNIWLKIIQSALIHPDDHLSKVQRTLAHYGALYGSVPAGQFSGTELPGSEKVDGTLFVRTAALTMKWMGRIREGEPARFWGEDPNFPESKVSERD